MSDVAFEDVDLVLVVDRDPVGLDVDGLAAVGLSAWDRGGQAQQGGEGVQTAGERFHGFGVGAFR